MKERLVIKRWYSASNSIKDGVTEVKEAKLFIRNTSKKEIKLPQWLYEGYPDDPRTEIYLEVMQKTEKGEYVKIDRGNPDIDYLLPQTFQTVGPGKEIEFDIQLDLFYKLSTKGKYKVRAILRLKSIPNCPEKTTSWQEFKVR
jgi:hypothetical protein